MVKSFEDMPAIADKEEVTDEIPSMKVEKLLPQSFEQDVCNLMKGLLHKSIAIFLSWHAMSLQNPPFSTKCF